MKEYPFEELGYISCRKPRTVSTEQRKQEKRCSIAFVDND